MGGLSPSISARQIPICVAMKNPPAVPTILFGLLIPLAVAAIGPWQSKSIASLVSAIPLHWLVAAQLYRVAGVIFLVLWAYGHQQPCGNSRLPAGIGDVTPGILAVVQAARLVQPPAIGSQRRLQCSGLFAKSNPIPVVTISIASMTPPERRRIFLRSSAPDLLVHNDVLSAGHGADLRPVPLALMLHGLVLLRLRRER